MSASITDNENMPLFLGLAVVVIILIAFFSKGGAEEQPKKSKGGGKKSKAETTRALPATAAATSKKNKKKKKAKAAAPEKKVVVEEDPTPEPVAEPEPETKSASKKKKKKKGSNGVAAKATTTTETEVTDASNDSDDDSDDDDLELWRIQSASKRKGANDATKRAAANKERERVRALERQEKKAAAEAKAAAEKAAAEEAKAKEEAELVAAAEASAKEEAAAAANKQAEASAKKNGASANGNVNATVKDVNAPTGEKKKRKRKKKKGKVIEESRPALVKPAAPSEQWEVVPQVEEWQEVNTKRTKQKAKMEAVAAAATSEDAAPFLSDEPVTEEPGETSVTLAAGDDPLIFIGKGGSTIQNLQDTTGAKFHLNRTTNILTISGPEDCVQHGLSEAQSILAAEAERKANETEERVTWGSDAIKAVIGRGGANIRAVHEATGVFINADVEAGTLVIVGPSDQVSNALTMCHNAAFGEVQDVLELGSRNAVNLVYGPNFETIRSLQDTTECKLDITRGSTTLKLAGSSEAVAEATAQIRALLEANRGFEMTIENSKVGAVYGKGGETLRSIQDRTGTQIDVSRGPTHATVSVMGTADGSARARNMLQRAIDGEVELQPGEVAEEVELGSATAAVIGRGGSNVVALEKKHGVKVNVRSELQKARVVGKPEPVAAAVKDIEAVAKPILDAEAAQKKADEAVESGESAWQVDASGDDADGW